MIVVDSSAVVELLSDAAGSRGAVGNALRIDADWVMPDHGPTEVANALRGIWLGKRSTDSEYDAQLAMLARMEPRLHPIVRLLPRMRELAANANAYDAAYIALAEDLDAPLVTVDRKFARVPGIRAEIRYAGA